MRKAIDKPNIRLDPTAPSTGKWWCYRWIVPSFGGQHCKQGKGYCIESAYRRYTLCHPTNVL